MSFVSPTKRGYLLGRDDDALRPLSDLWRRVMQADRQAVRALLGEIMVGNQRVREREADGWVYVTIDPDDQDEGIARMVVNVSGPYPSPEEALIASQRQYEQDKRLLERGEPGWLHVVVPLYGPEKSA